MNASFRANFKRPGEDEIQSLYIGSHNEIIDIDTVEDDNLLDWYRENVVSKVLKRVEDFEAKRSGWKFDSTIELKVNCNQYDVLRGGKYIKLHGYLQNKGCIVNVQNGEDNYCFKWAILASIYKRISNPHRLRNYLPYENELDFTGIDFPVKLKDVRKFELLNQTISVNVSVYFRRN